MLTAIVGGRSVSHSAVLEALRRGSCLVLDCANACDPYAYLEHVPPEAFESVHVQGFDMLHSLLDAIGEAPLHLETLGLERLCVTSTRGLHTYHDENENASVRARAWTLLTRLARRYEVTVAVERGSTDERLAHLHAHTITEEPMGHTVASQRTVVEDLKATLARYRRGLRREDQQAFDRLTSTPFSYVSSMSYASSIHTWALYLLSICLEQEKELERLRRHTGLEREQVQERLRDA